MLLVHAAVKPNRCLNPRETDALLSAPLPFLKKLSRLQTLPDNNEQVVTGVLKYVPQVLLNIRRRSTKGWTIWNVILDLTGGLLSVVQVFILPLYYKKAAILWYLGCLVASAQGSRNKI